MTEAGSLTPERLVLLHFLFNRVKFPNENSYSYRVA